MDADGDTFTFMKRTVEKTDVYLCFREDLVPSDIVFDNKFLKNNGFVFKILCFDRDVCMLEVDEMIRSVYNQVMFEKSL